LPGPPALPRKDQPSCCYLPSRVLTRPRYDAHRLRQASDVSYVLEALTRPPNVGLRFRLPSSCELQPASRFAARPYPSEGGISFGLIPFSAVIVRRDGQNSTPIRVPPTGFHTLLTRNRPQRRAGLFHPAGTPRVVGLQSLTANRSPDRFLPAMLLHRCPALRGIHSTNPGLPQPATQVSPRATLDPSTPRPLAETGPTVGLSQS